MVGETKVGIRLSSVCVCYVDIDLIKYIVPSGCTFRITMERVK